MTMASCLDYLNILPAKTSAYVKFNRPNSRWHIVKDINATLKKLSPSTIYVDNIFIQAKTRSPPLKNKNKKKKPKK